MGFIDIYHLEFKTQLFSYFILSLIIYYLCRQAAYGLILCLLGYQLGILGEASIINYIIDPFLWVGCILALLWRFGKVLTKKIHRGKKI